MQEDNVPRKLSFRELYNFKFDDAKGRASAMMYTVMEAIITQMTAGIFYTGFLLAHGISLVNLGIITFIPFLCNMLAMFSPILFSRVKHQKSTILILRFLYFCLNILGITLIPSLVHNEDLRIILLVAVLFLANLSNALTSAAISSWHISFIPDEHRAQYFSVTNMLTNLIPLTIALALSWIVDSFPENEQLPILTFFRYLAFVLAIVDLFILSLPKEIRMSSNAQKLSVKQLFLLPIRHKPFLLTAIYAFIANFGGQLYGAPMNVFFLDIVGVPYLYTSVINATYFLFFFIFSVFWQKYIRKHSWFGAVRLTQVSAGLSYGLFCLVTPTNYWWLLTFFRLFQHWIGVGSSIAGGNLQFIHAPFENRIAYISFYIFATNAGAMLGVFTYTQYISLLENWTYTLFGQTYTSIHLIMAIGGLIVCGSSLYLYLFRKQLDPKKSI